jgi:hypothetical protein
VKFTDLKTLTVPFDWVPFRTLPKGHCGLCGAFPGECAPDCDDDNVPDEQVRPRRCLECRCEMSATLDAYHGTDDEQRRRCVRCRR